MKYKSKTKARENNNQILCSLSQDVWRTKKNKRSKRGITAA